MTTLAPQRRFPMAIYWVLFVVIGIVSFLPLLTTIFSVAIANAYDCNVSESVLNPCIIDGTDWGRELQFGGISFWYVLVTWPLGFVLFLIWLAVLLIHRGRFKRRAA